MGPRHLPPGIEIPVYEAICALVSCKGLEAIHLQTIRYCIGVCPDGFERTYIAYFDRLSKADSQPASCEHGMKNLGRRGRSTMLRTKSANDLRINDIKQQTATLN
jgi:hypothetical protein